MGCSGVCVASPQGNSVYAAVTQSREGRVGMAVLIHHLMSEKCHVQQAQHTVRGSHWLGLGCLVQCLTQCVVYVDPNFTWISFADTLFQSILFAS